MVSHFKQHVLNEPDDILESSLNLQLSVALVTTTSQLKHSLFILQNMQCASVQTL